MTQFHKYHNLSSHTNENKISFKYLRSKFFPPSESKAAEYFLNKGIDSKHLQASVATCISHLHLYFSPSSSK